MSLLSSFIKIQSLLLYLEELSDLTDGVLLGLVVVLNAPLDEVLQRRVLRLRERPRRRLQLPELGDGQCQVRVSGPGPEAGAEADSGAAKHRVGLVHDVVRPWRRPKNRVRKKAEGG